jgi:hypothetical protein
MQRTIGLWRALKSPRLGKIPAPSQNIGGKVWRPLTIGLGRTSNC